MKHLNAWGYARPDHGTFFRMPRILLDTPKGDVPPTPPVNNPPDLTALQNQNAELLKRLEALEKGNQPPAPAPKGDDGDLAAKAAKDREAKDKQAAESQKLERALKFIMGGAEFVKTNATLLPKNVEAIFAQAEKEKYDNQMEKADAIRLGIVTEFFAIQDNLDLLTDTQKLNLAEFQALTKNVKQERVQQIYENLFEPAFKAKQGQVKAAQLKSGEVDPANEKAAYAKRIADISRNKFIKKGVK